MSQNMRKSHYNDEKYNQTIADTLKKMEHQVHYKLYMIWAKDGYTDITGKKIEGYHTNQAFLAKAMGVSRQQFSDYIKEVKPTLPDVYKLFKLSTVLGIPLEYFADDTVEYLPNPATCSSQQFCRVNANKALCTKLVNDHLNSEYKESERKLKNLLQEVGLDRGVVQRLTDAALSNLTQALKETVTSILSDKSNINEPVNPIDPDDLE